MSTSLFAPATWTFTQGLIVGQASMVILALVFVRYVVFSGTVGPETDWRVKRDAKAKVSCEFSYTLTRS